MSARACAIVLLAVVAMATPGAALAQGGRLTAVDLPPQLASSTRQAIERLADSLRAEHLPADAIYAKAAEGVLKGASDARILAAVRRLASALGEARDALGPSADDAELDAGASALVSGASAATLRRLRDVSRQRGESSGSGLATPLVVLVDLLTRHVPATVASAAIDSLVVRQAPPDDFTALRAAVERDIEAGRTPEAATLLRTRSLLETLNGRQRPLAPRGRRPFPPVGS